MNVLVNKNGWAVDPDGFCRPHTFPAVCFSREGLVSMIRKYRKNCRIAGVKPGRLEIRQA